MEENNDWRRLYALLRDVRAEAQNLLAFVAEIQKSGGFKDETIRGAEFKRAIATRLPLCLANTRQMKKLLGQIHAVFERNAEIYDYFGDVVTQIANGLERIESGWPADDLAPDESLRQLDEITVSLNNIVWLCALVTIPQRVKIHLDQMRTGNALDFTAEFADELPDAGQRTRLLEYLRRHPREISGVVDVDNGIIIKAEMSAKARWVSLLRIAGLVVLSGVLISLLPLAAPHFEEWPFPLNCQKTLITGYMMIIVGSLAHILIEALKQKKRNANKPRFAALDDWILWVHVRETSILVGIATSVAGYLLFAGFKNGVFGWQTAFLVGYSMDSFLELFLQRFDKLVTKQTDTIKESLNATGPNATTSSQTTSHENKQA